MGRTAHIAKSADGGRTEPGAEVRDADPWSLLDRELDAWNDRPASFWLRDDDATAPSAALDRLLLTAARHGVPVTLAVIPARAGDDLARRVSAAGRTRVIQHGWDHADHAAAGGKRIELGGTLEADAAVRALTRGRLLLERIFGRCVLPVLAPPWNRIAPDVATRIGEAGLVGLSLFGARPASDVGRLQRNVHLDPILWREGERFAGAGPVLLAAVRHLRARRLGEVAEEPTGLMTHHLRHDADADRFVDSFLARTSAHPNARWLDAAEVFAPGDDGKGAAHAA